MSAGPARQQEYDDMKQVARILDAVMDGRADCPVSDCAAALDAMHAWHASIADLPAATRGHLREAGAHCRACGRNCGVARAVDDALARLDTADAGGRRAKVTTSSAFRWTCPADAVSVSSA